MAFPHTKSFKVEKNLKLPSIFSNKKSSIFEKVKKMKIFKNFQKCSKIKFAETFKKEVLEIIFFKIKEISPPCFVPI